MICPAREKIVVKRFLFFNVPTPQPHKWRFYISWCELWWEISKTCEFCGGSEREWPFTDFELMERLDLKRCPDRHRLVHEDFDLEQYRATHPAAGAGEKEQG